MPWCMNSEIYPTHVRGAGVSLSTSTNWIVNLAMSLTFLTTISAIGLPAAFCLYATISFGFWIFFLMYLPETRGLQLEEISRLFDDQNWGKLFSIKKFFRQILTGDRNFSLLTDKNSNDGLIGRNSHNKNGSIAMNGRHDQHRSRSGSGEGTFSEVDLEDEVEEISFR